MPLRAAACPGRHAWPNNPLQRGRPAGYQGHQQDVGRCHRALVGRLFACPLARPGQQRACTACFECSVRGRASQPVPIPPCAAGTACCSGAASSWMASQALRSARSSPAPASCIISRPPCPARTGEEVFVTGGRPAAPQHRGGGSAPAPARAQHSSTPVHCRYHSHFRDQYIDGKPEGQPGRGVRHAAWLQQGPAHSPLTPHAAPPSLCAASRAGLKGAIVVADPSIPDFPVTSEMQVLVCVRVCVWWWWWWWCVCHGVTGSGVRVCVCVWVGVGWGGRR